MRSTTVSVDQRLFFCWSCVVLNRSCSRFKKKDAINQFRSGKNRLIEISNRLHIADGLWCPVPVRLRCQYIASWNKWYVLFGHNGGSRGVLWTEDAPLEQIEQVMLISKCLIQAEPNYSFAQTQSLLLLSFTATLHVFVELRCILKKLLIEKLTYFCTPLNQPWAPLV